MTSHPRPPIRHCPICGVAMQSSRTREDGRDFDRFDCQTCHTVIELPRPPRDDAQAR
jgi:hypothetical protein